MGLVLLVHALLLLLMLGSRMRSRDQKPAIAYVGLWVTPRPEPTPATTGQPASPKLRPIPASPAVAPPMDDGTTAPAPAPIPVPESTPPAVDWNSEATSAARRHAGRRDISPTFSPEPKTQRKPCAPPKSRFEWHREEPRVGFAPLPYVRLGKRCIVGLGFGCILGPLPEANGHLLDDIAEGKTQDSSVPDPELCD
ncbi:MAG: hypothetical protein QM696_11420 [Steroidobacteraceae bacterium]